MITDIKNIDMNVAIAPRHIRNPRGAIERKLSGMVSRYVHSADGILLKWSDLTILNDKGMIIDDQPFLFYKITFVAQVFKPVEGKIVLGKIHQMEKSYLVAKAMNSFLVTVSVPEDQLQNKTYQQMMIDQEIYFRITGASNGVYMGTLDAECLKLTKNSIKASATDEVYEYAKDFEY